MTADDGNPYSAKNLDEPIRPSGRPGIGAMIFITFASLVAGFCFFVCSCFGLFWAGNVIDAIVPDAVLSAVGPVLFFGMPFVVVFAVGRILWKALTPRNYQPGVRKPWELEKGATDE